MFANDNMKFFASTDWYVIESDSNIAIINSAFMCIM